MTKLPIYTALCPHRTAIGNRRSKNLSPHVLMLASPILISSARLIRTDCTTFTVLWKSYLPHTVAGETTWSVLRIYTRVFVYLYISHNRQGLLPEIHSYSFLYFCGAIHLWSSEFQTVIKSRSCTLQSFMKSRSCTLQSFMKSSSCLLQSFMK